MRWLPETAAFLLVAGLLLAQQKSTPPPTDRITVLEQPVGELEKRLTALEKGAEAVEGKTKAKPTPVIPSPTGYIGNARSLKLHRPDCKWAQKTAPQNRVVVESREEAIKQGYQPCKVCQP